LNFLEPAARILEDFQRNPQTNLKLLLNRSLKRYPGPADVQQITRTVYGVVRKGVAVERLIARFARRKSGATSLPPGIQVLLKIAIFLMLFSDSFPDYAVVNETVNLIEKSKRPFVNGLLRTISRQKLRLREEIASDPDPAGRHSIAPLLVENLAMISDDLDSDLAYLDREPLFHLRLNTRLIGYASAREMLQRERIEFRELPQFDSFEIATAWRLRTRLASGGAFYLQNTGAQVVAIIAAQYARRTVWDAAAAPGAKSMTLGLLRPDLTLLTSDLHLGRLRLLKQNLDRSGLANVRMFAADTRRPAIGENAADLIMVDAPCTASGTLRKNPDLKAKINSEMVNRNSGIQRELLHGVRPLLTSGYLLYAVCSFLGAETEQVMTTLCQGMPCRVVDLSPILDRFGFFYRRGAHGFYLLPSVLNNDLFYISLLKIVSPSAPD